MAYKAFPVWKIKAKNVYGKDLPTFWLSEYLQIYLYQVFYVTGENKSHWPCRNLTSLLVAENETVEKSQEN